MWSSAIPVIFCPDSEHLLAISEAIWNANWIQIGSAVFNSWSITTNWNWRYGEIDVRLTKFKVGCVGILTENVRRILDKTKKGFWDDEIKLPYLILFLARAINKLIVTVLSSKWLITYESLVKTQTLVLDTLLHLYCTQPAKNDKFEIFWFWAFFLICNKVYNAFSLTVKDRIEVAHSEDSQTCWGSHDFFSHVINKEIGTHDE